MQESCCSMGGLSNSVRMITTAWKSSWRGLYVSKPTAFPVSHINKEHTLVYKGNWTILWKEHTFVNFFPSKSLTSIYSVVWQCYKINYQIRLEGMFLLIQPSVFNLTFLKCSKSCYVPVHHCVGTPAFSDAKGSIKIMGNNAYFLKCSFKLCCHPVNKL